MIKAKKSLSQNFLFDKNISNKIVNQSNIKNKIVLEIGPGYGFLTDTILDNSPKKLYLVEKDINLIKLLKLKYSNNSKIIFLGDDILNINLDSFNDLIVISNLPYNISTKIVLHLFKFNQNISEMILMIQKEVAEKFDYSSVNMNKYKFLTKIISNYSMCFEVSPKVFNPKPKVKSMIVKFKFKKEIIDYKKAKNFSNLIFKNVRKKINNNINIDIKDKILNKRVNELSIEELLYIYNFF